MRIILFLIFVSQALFASITLESTTVFAMRNGIIGATPSSTPFEVVLDGGSGTNDSPFDVYYPITSNGTDADSTGEINRSFTGVADPHDNLPDIENYTAGGVGGLQIIFSVSPASSARPDIYAAISSGQTGTNASDFTVVNMSTGFDYDDRQTGGQVEVNGSANTAVTVKIDLGAHCSANSDCDIPTANDASPVSRELIIFSSPTSTAFVEGDGITDDELSNSVFFNLKFAAREPSVNATINSNDADIPTLSVTRGDEQLRIQYSTGGAAINASEVQSVIACNLSVAAAAQSDYNQITNVAPLCTQLQRIEEAVNKSADTVNYTGLTNGVPVDVTICVNNKWNFCSGFTPSVVGTPKALETFIDEQSCYLLSAGFKEDHYVLSFLRAFRDNVLKKSIIGIEIVNFYESTAPLYAMYIAKSTILSAIFRGIGFLAYFMLKFYVYILTFLGLILLFKGFNVFKWQK